MKTTHLRQLILAGITVLGPSLITTAAGAQVDIHIGVQIPLPPPLVFAAPPQVVVLPQTYVYAVPSINEDVYFYDGYWWRPWQGHWYRSHYYDRGWGSYPHVPYFYRQVPHDWRHEYESRQWRGQAWNYELMPHEKVQKDWNKWKKEKYWETHETWGVQGLKPEKPPHEEKVKAPKPQHYDKGKAAPEHKDKKDK